MAPDPALMLLAFAAVAAITLVLLWPARRALAGLRRVRREAERVRLEDALKHMHECERAGRACTLENLAGRLETSRGAASDLLTRLTERGLAVVGPSGVELTGPGRAYALRIVRTHRLWERYLADRTGVPAVDWHEEAERVEHELTQEEAEDLAARLGHPRYDPHGDPIPTAGGEIPAPVGVPLPRVVPGRHVVVRHLEDEPREVFERLVGLGLAPGVPLEVLDGEGEGEGAARGAVRIRVQGVERSVRAADAGNVTVEEVAEDVGSEGRSRTLADAEPGQEVRVTSLSPACQGPQRRRMLDLGVVPGTRITPELVSTSGDPVAYRIRGALIALRRHQASWIEVDAEPVERAG
ncbi:MAG TPA: iron dependent repressor, metal binding and dimerization domain protein [Actinomycetota bacterium]|nr:iron dependent repressor, metal binding and dimerization domain protein [Actinomycetota bacterium]